jgi:hypothetical protein
MDRDNNALAVIVILGIVVLLALYGVSTSIGASFNSVVHSAGLLVAVTAAIFAIYWFVKDGDFEWIIGSAWFVCAWPCIWPVLTSVANGGVDDESYFHPWHTSILDSGWLQWGIESAFLVLLAFAIYRRHARKWY